MEEARRERVGDSEKNRTNYYFLCDDTTNTISMAFVGKRVRGATLLYAFDALLP